VSETVDKTYKTLDEVFKSLGKLYIGNELLYRTFFTGHSTKTLCHVALGKENSLSRHKVTTMKNLSSATVCVVMEIVDVGFS
jgi:hypothetical protein